MSGFAYKPATCREQAESRIERFGVVSAAAKLICDNDVLWDSDVWNLDVDRSVANLGWDVWAGPERSRERLGIELAGPVARTRSATWVQCINHDIELFAAGSVCQSVAEVAERDFAQVTSSVEVEL